MANYGIKLNLGQLEDAFLGSVQGKNCIIIPVEANHLFCTENGGAYLDLTAFEMRQPGKFGGTHLLKRSLTKGERETLTAEQRQGKPILGDMKPFESGRASAPREAFKPVDVSGPDVTESAPALKDEEDLPF